MLVLLFSTLVYRRDWWYLSAGEFLELKISPFFVDLYLLGKLRTLDLLQYLCLGVAFVFFLSSLFMILGSVYTKGAYSPILIRISFLKTFWVVLFTTIVPVALSLILSQQYNVHIPIAGVSSITFKHDTPEVLLVSTLKVRSAFSELYYLAIFVAIISIIAGYRHRKYYQ